MITVQLTRGRSVSFPDEATPQEMRSFVEREYPIEPEDTEELIRTDPSYVPTQDEFAAWESSKKGKGLVGWAQESWKNFNAGEVASRLTDVVSQGVGGLFSDPLKAPASVVEGVMQGGAQLDGLLMQSQNPSSPAFRFRSWITGNDTVKDRYMQFLEAREYSKWLRELDEGAKTVLIDKGYVNPELTRLVGTVADPSSFVPFATVGKLLAKGAAVGISKPLGAAGRVATKVGGAGERVVDNVLKTVGDVVGVESKDAVKAAALGGSVANQVSGGGTGTIRKLINAPTLVRAGGQIAEAAADRLRNAPTRVGPMEGLAMLPNATPVDKALGFVGTHGGDAAIDMGLHGASGVLTGAAVSAGLGLYSDPDNTLTAAFEGSVLGGTVGGVAQGVGRVTGRAAKAARANDLTRFINSDDKNAGAVKAVAEAHGVDAGATFMDTINLARGVLGDLDVNVLDSTGWATRELPRARGIYVDTREGGQIFINQDILTRDGAKATDAAQTLGHELFHALKDVEQLAPQVQALRDAVIGKTIINSSGGVDMVREGLVTGDVLDRLWQRYRDMAPDTAKADMDRMTSESDRREYIFDEVGAEYLGQLLAGGNPDTVLRAHNSLRSNIADMLIKHRTETFLGKAAGWFAQRGMRDVDSILFNGDIPKATALANAMLRDLVRARAKLGERIVRDGDASRTLVRKGDLGEAGVGELMEDIGLATRDPASGKYKWKSVAEVESKSREEVSALMEIISRYADPIEGGMEPDGDAVAGSRLSPSQLSAIEADMRIGNKLKEMLRAISASTQAMEDGGPNVLQMVYGAATTRRRNKLTDRFRSVYSSGVRVSTRTVVPFDLRLEADTNAGNPYVRGLDLSKLRNDARDAASKGGLGPWGRDYGAFTRDLSRYIALMDNPSTPPGRAAEIFGADNAGVLARWLSAKEKGGSKYVHSFRLDRMIKLDPTGEHHRMSTETWRRAEVRYQPVGDNMRRGDDGSTLVKGSRGWRRYRNDGKLAGVHSTESEAKAAAAKDAGREYQGYGPKYIERSLGRNDDYARAYGDDEVMAALVRANGNKLIKGLKEVLPSGEIVVNDTGKPISEAYGAARKLPEGTKVAVRIDIPTFNRSPENARVYAQTIHVPGRTGEVPGSVLGYDRLVRLKNVEFSVKQSTAEKINQGEQSKSPIATAIGEYQRSMEIPPDINDWTPVGMDPKDHSFFYDKATDEAVIGGDEALSVGNTVFVKNPIYGNRGDYRFMPDKPEHRAERERVKSGKPKGVFLFAGGGLMELGLWGKVQASAAVEYAKEIADHYATAHGKHVINSGVQDVDYAKFKGSDYLHASPVCKNYSDAKVQRGEVELDLVTARATARAIRQIEPRIFTLENVPDYRDGKALKIITAELDRMGFAWDMDVYDAADFGAPTHRKRLLLRALREGQLPPKPLPEKRLGWYQSVSDLIPDMPYDADLPRYMKERLNVSSAQELPTPMFISGGSAYKGTIPHAMGDEPAPTIKASHKEEHRIVVREGGVNVIKRVTPRAIARIQGVPDSYPLPKDKKVARTILGNGVPPPLARAVFGPLVDSVKRQRKRLMPLDSSYAELVMRGDMNSAQKMVDEAAKEARGDREVYGPLFHHGEFSQGDHGVPDTSNGMHFGSRQAAEDRAYQRGADSEHASLEVFEEDGRWYWKTDNLESVTDDGFDTADAARINASYDIDQFTDSTYQGDPDELGNFTSAYIYGKFKRVEDQGASWESAIRTAKREGFTGLVYRNRFEDSGNDSYVVFQPNQIKSADPVTYDKNGDIVPLSQRFNSANNDIRFMPDQDGFYSQLAQVVERKLPKRFTAQQAIGATDPAKGSGVKAEELKWTGFAQIAEQIANENGGKIDRDKLIERLREDSAMLLREEQAFGHYSNYVMGGKSENYKELVLVKKSDPSRYLERHYNSERFWGYIAHMRTTERSDTAGKSGLFIDEVQSTRHQKGQQFGYQSEDAVFNRARFQELTDKRKAIRELSESRDSLSVSIWSRDEAIRSINEHGDKPVMWRDELRRWNEDLIHHNKVIERMTEKIRDIESKYGEDAAWTADDQSEFLRLRLEATPGNDFPVPDAPHRNDWYLQLFKRALRDAVASGKDWIGWTPAQTHADLYSHQLQGIVKRVDWRDGMASVSTKKGEVIEFAYDKDGVMSGYGDSLDGKKVSSLLGEEAHKKITGSSSGSMTGDRLFMGSQLYRTIYDSEGTSGGLPKLVAKYVKQWGATVSKRPVESAEGYPVVYYREIGSGDPWLFHSDGVYRHEAKDYVAANDNYVADLTRASKVQHRVPHEFKWSNVGRKVTDVWSVDITPEMRESVAKMGQPRFMPDAPVVDGKSVRTVKGRSFRLTSDAISRFLPVGGVDLMDYKDRTVVALVADRMGVGDLHVGPDGRERELSVKGQGGAGFMHIFNGGGWAFTGVGQAKGFMRRLRAAAQPNETSVVVAITALSDTNHLHNHAGQLAFVEAIEQAIATKQLSRRAADAQFAEVRNRIVQSDAKSVEKIGIKGVLDPLKTFGDYAAAVRGKAFNFPQAGFLKDRWNAATLPIKQAELEQMGVSVAATARKTADPRYARADVYDVVALLEVPLDQQGQESDFHYVYKGVVHGRAIGFLRKFVNADKLMSSGQKVRNKKGRITTQPMQTVIPKLDLINQYSGN